MKKTLRETMQFLLHRDKRVDNDVAFAITSSMSKESLKELYRRMMNKEWTEGNNR